MPQASAIVEGVVEKIENEYSEANGPWTKITLQSIKVHRGSLNDPSSSSKVIIRQRGGIFPDGRRMRVSVIADFTVGERYIVILKNTAWHWMPYLGAPIRVAELPSGKQVLVSPQQNVLVDVTQSGLLFSGTTHFEDRDAGAFSPTQRKAGYEQLPDSPIPSKALSVSTMLKQLDAEMSTQGIELSGSYYDEPVSYSPTIPVEPQSVVDHVDSPDASKEP